MSTERASLERILEEAERVARQRGFRLTGIYHLLGAARVLDEEAYRAWLAARRVPEPEFSKALEHVLRPRRAAGGIPRDRQDAALGEAALEAARAAAGSRPATTADLGAILASLPEEPILSLCERFAIEPEGGATSP